MHLSEGKDKESNEVGNKTERAEREKRVKGLNK
jgi:hypothetical protein